MTQTAGDMITLLDSALPANAYWSVYDAAAGTNAKVYRNNNPAVSSDYYVYVDDNYTTYCIIQLWSGWDAGAHAGLGDRVPTVASAVTCYIRKPLGPCCISVNDTRFVFVNVSLMHGYYVGQLKRFDTTKNMPVLIVTKASGGAYSPLGDYNRSGDNVYWVALYDHLGNVGTLLELWGIGSASRSYRTSLSSYYVFESPVMLQASPYTLLGLLDGVCDVHRNLLPLTGGDQVIVNGTQWLHYQDTASANNAFFIKKG